jgi:hypothetical protein
LLNLKKNSNVFFYKKSYNNIVLIDQKIKKKIKNSYFSQIFKKFKNEKYLPAKIYKIVKYGKMKRRGAFFSFMGGFFFFNNKKRAFFKKKKKEPFIHWKKIKKLKFMDFQKIPNSFLKAI